MPTENRRIATYLPKHIDERLQAFKVEHTLKGDSQALIVILSEFFQVSQEVTPLSSSVTLELQNRIEALEEKFFQIKNELLSELRGELLDHRGSLIGQIESEVIDKLPSELESEPSRTEALDEQLKLIPEKESPLTDASSEPLSEPQHPLPISDSPEPMEWLTTKEVFEILKPNCSYNAFRSLSPEDLHRRYDLQVDPHRKKGKHNVKWLRLPGTESLLQASSIEEKPEFKGELLGESEGVIPEF